jgi:hypothetical protein
LLIPVNVQGGLKGDRFIEELKGYSLNFPPRTHFFETHNFNNMKVPRKKLKFMRKYYF